MLTKDSIANKQRKLFLNQIVNACSKMIIETSEGKITKKQLIKGTRKLLDKC